MKFFLARKRLLIIACLLGVSGAFPASRITLAAELPGSVDPSRLQDRLTPPQSLPAEEQKILPDTHVDFSGPVPHPEQGFILSSVTIEGATAFRADVLADAYKDSLGQPADLSTLQFIAGRITQLYRDNGYLLSRAIVPQQSIEGGHVRLVVVEGYIAQIRLEGEGLSRLRAYDQLGLLQDIQRNITAMRPLNGPALERQLLLMDNFSGIHVHAILEALPKAQAVPGAIGLVLQVEDVADGMNVSIDNFGSRYAGPVELTGSAVTSSTALAFDRLSLSVLATSQLKEAKVTTLDYATPVTANGTSVSFRLGYSTLTPGFTLRPLQVESESYNAAVQVQQNLIRSRRGNLSVSAGVDFANITTDFATTNLYKDKIRALRIGAQFDWIDSHQGSNNGSLILSQGLDFLGTRPTGSMNLSRALGHSDFTKITASLARLQQINDDWQVYGAVIGQYAWNPLLSSEQFGYGGQAFGRAYDPSEISGDSGVAGSLELRYTGIPEWQNTFFQPFAFYDSGKTWTAVAASNRDINSGTSAGSGVRFLYHGNVSGYVSIAVPMTTPSSDPPAYANGHSPRYLFQISSHF